MKKYLASLGFVLHLMVPDAFAQSHQSIVSLDYCADQYVLALSEREDIRALSPAAQSSYSYFRELSPGIDQVRPEAEAILNMAPTLVIRQWGGGFQTPVLLNKLGVETAQISFGTDLAQAEANLLAMGKALGASKKAEALLADMQMRLKRIDRAVAQRRVKLRALYLTPGGVSAGQGTFVDDLMTRAGVINIAAEKGAKGWPDVKLEDLVLNPPDMIITGFFDLGAEQPSHWSIARHSHLRQIFRDVPTLHLPGRLLACSAWFGVEAVEQIHEASQSPLIAEAYHGR